MAAGMDAALAVAAEAEARGQAGNGCVIVDPGTGEIVASGGDNSVAHPLKWVVQDPPLEQSCIFEETRTGHPVSGSPPPRSSHISGAQCTCWPVIVVVWSRAPTLRLRPPRHAVMVAIDAMGRRDLRLWPDWYQGVHHRHRNSDGDQDCCRRGFAVLFSSSRRELGADLCLVL